jgi:predicted deacylase
MARAYGVGVVLSVAKTRGYGFEERLIGLLADAAIAKNIPTLTVELTPWYEWDEAAIQSGVLGTLNVLKFAGMLEGEPEPQTGVPFLPEVVGPQLRVTARKGGFVQPLVQAGTWVSNGQPVAIVRNPWGDNIEEICAPADGYVLAYPHHGTHSVASGDVAVFVAPPSNLS